MQEYPVLTEEGKKKLVEELKYLKEVKRPEIKKRIELAKEHGDLSENAEYHDAREEQSFVEGRILEIESILKCAVSASSAMSGAIKVGTKVTVETEGERVEYTIVGSHEAKPETGLISCDSPLGQALLGHRESDEVAVTTPKGEINYKIESIK